MSKIIIGTTPTITYTFNEVSVSDIVTAILTIKANNNIVVEKHLEDAVIGESSLSWTLTQSETLSFGTNTMRMMLNWKLGDGTRGASAYYAYRATNTSALSIGGVHCAYNSDSQGSGGINYPRFWTDELGFTPNSASTSRYWRAGRTYKWIAIWGQT